MKYTEPLNSSAYPDRNGSYVDANPATGVKGSTVPGKSIEAPQREIVNVISASGLTPDGADNTQLLQALRGMIQNSSSGNKIYTGTATDSEILALLQPGDLYIRKG